MTIYLIRNKLNNKVYVGKTIHPLKARWRRHICDATRGSSFAIHRALLKYGADNFELHTLFHASHPITEERLFEWEKFFIQAFRANQTEHGYNLTPGGQGKAGGTTSDELRRKRSIARKGKKLSEEQCRINSESHKGLKHSEETRRKMSEARKGHTVSLETREKISKSQKGRKQSEEHRRKNSESHKGLPIAPGTLANLRRIAREKRDTHLYTGVSFYKRESKWTASVWVKPKTVRLGYFATELEAARRVAEAQLLLSQIALLTDGE